MKDRWDTQFIFYICVYTIIDSFLETGNLRWIFIFSFQYHCEHRSVHSSYNIFNMLKPFRVLVLLDGQIILLLKLTSRTLPKSVEILALIYVSFGWKGLFRFMEFFQVWGDLFLRESLVPFADSGIKRPHNTGAGSIHCYMTILSVGKLLIRSFLLILFSNNHKFILLFLI